MKTTVKIIVALFILTTLTTCTKIYKVEDKAMFETILTNGVWQYEERKLNCKINEPNEEQRPIFGNYEKLLKFYCRVFNPNGNIDIYFDIQFYDELSSREICDKLFTGTNTNYIIKKDGEKKYYEFTLGTWWVEADTLYIKSDFYDYDLHRDDYSGYIHFNFETDLIFCSPFISKYKITKFSEDKIVFDTEYKANIYKYENNTCIKTDETYILKDHFELINVKQKE